MGCGWEKQIESISTQVCLREQERRKLTGTKKSWMMPVYPPCALSSAVPLRTAWKPVALTLRSSLDFESAVGNFTPGGGGQLQHYQRR